MNKETEFAPGPESVTPKATVARLCLYLRQLEEFHRQGKETISSVQLGRALEVSDAQVRKDLAYFGQFGHPGVGYRVVELRQAIKAVLGTDRSWRLALVGVGNLGRALLGYRGFADRGFVFRALFDRDPALVGANVHGMVVREIASLARHATADGLDMAVLAVPVAAADEAAQAVVAAGITAILNFAPTKLKVPDDVCVVAVDLALLFEQLAFQRTHTLPFASSFSHDMDGQSSDCPVV